MNHIFYKLKKNIFGKKSGFETILIEDNKFFNSKTYRDKENLEFSSIDFCIQEILEEIMKKFLHKIFLTKSDIIKSRKANGKMCERDSIENFEETIFNENKSKFFVYETYVNCNLNKKDNENNDETEKKNKIDNELIYGFIPSNITVRRVPSYILGTGVLGRAFIHQNYVEILDSLIGTDYIEVLTHELFHINMPHYSETQIRSMTRRYIPNARYN